MGLARSHPFGFARYASLGRWEPARHLHLLTGKLVDLSARRIKKFMVFKPPRHGKSTITSHYFPAWYLGTFPNDEIILASYEASFASNWGARVRDTMAEVGPKLWGLTVRSDWRAASDWHLSGLDANGGPVQGSMRTAGVGTGVTGRGANLIIIDDPIKDAMQANSKTYRESLWDWYQSTLFTRLEPDGIIIVMLTRWHEDDLAGRLLREEGDEWEVLSMPALCTDPDNDPLGRKEGEALWPERWPRELLLERKRSINDYWWGALFQQNPVPESGHIIKRDWWQFWKPPGSSLGPVNLGRGEIKYPVELPAMEQISSSWDLAFTKGEGTSFIVGQKWGKRSADMFLLDQVRARMDFPETVKAFMQFHRDHPDIDAKWIEEKANASALITICGPHLGGILPVNIPGDKTDRLRNSAPYVESAHVFIPHPDLYPWVRPFIAELTAFPAAPDDDQADTFSQAIHQLNQSEGTIAFGNAHMY